MTKQALEKENSTIFDEDKNHLFTNYQKSVKPGLFKNESYQAFFDNSVWEDYEELVYAVQRDKYDKTIEIASNEAIHPSEVIRPTGDNIMHICAEYGRVKLLTYFNKNGGELWSKNYAEELPIHLAAREGQNEAIVYILDNSSISVDVEMLDGWTPFHYAVNNGYLSTVELLVSRGANINAVDKFKRSALHWAVRYNFTEIVEFLLQSNINYDLIDAEDQTAYQMAKSLSNIDLMELMEEHFKSIGIITKKAFKPSQFKT